MKKIILGVMFASAFGTLSACQPQQEVQQETLQTEKQMTVNTMMTDNMITKKSMNSVDVTIDRLEAAAKEKGLRIFARINHQENAAGLDLTMHPSTLLIFGSPKLGAPLMNAAPTIGLDLPVKALAYEGKDGMVYISYNNPAYLKNRHNVEGADMPLVKMTKALDGLTNHAIAK